MKRFYLALPLALGVVILLAALGTAPRGASAGDDGITFSHKTHAEAAECSTCHKAVTESTSAGDNLFPTPSVCIDCHGEPDVRGYWNLKEGDALDASYIKPRDHKLVFSHKQHLGEHVKCTGCHVGIPADASPALPSMETCYACHNNGEKISPIIRGEATDTKHPVVGMKCESCHTSLAGMMPQNHRLANFTQTHGKYAGEGESNRECAPCHSVDFCQECHTPTNDVPAGVGKDQFYIEGWPRGEKMDDGAELTVQKVHSQVYRYTHGFDARAKTTRCETCHEPASFCTPCHQNGYDATGMRVVPQSHQMAGFATIGGQRDQNRHAKLAEMDMESCVTCHEVDGGDPVCAGCHSTGTIPGGDK